jgi:peptidoglycan hydrolase CwlO-like protein
MKKSIVHKKVNLFLVMLVAGVVTLVLGMSTFYQSSFRPVTSKYAEASSSLQACQGELTNYKSQLDIALQAINSTSEDIEKYDYLYENKTKELTMTRQELAETEDELDDTKKTLSNYKSLYKREQEHVQELEDDMGELQDAYDDVKRLYRNKFNWVKNQKKQ